MRKEFSLNCFLQLFGPGVLDIVTDVVDKGWPQHCKEHSLEDHGKDAKDDEEKAVEPERRATEDLRWYTDILEHRSKEWDIVVGLNGEKDGYEEVGDYTEEDEEVGYGCPEEGVQSNLQEEAVG